MSLAQGESRKRARDLLIDHLGRLRRDGVEEAWLGENSRAFLRDLFLGKSKPAAPKASLRVSEPDAGVDSETGHQPKARVVRKTAKGEPRRFLPKVDAPEVPLPRAGTKEERIEVLRNAIGNCEKVSGLKNLRDQLVFSTGNPDAELMIVGEAPGYEEEKQGEPFVGPAGEMLTKIIETMGLRRDQVYISNIVKYRPQIAGMDDQGVRNRKPDPEEMATCLPYIQAEIQIVEPRVLVALGATAIEALLDTPTSVGKARQDWHQVLGVPMRATYHPSYLLRNESLTERRKLWLDMLEVMDRLGLPISDKQRGFFKK